MGSGDVPDSRLTSPTASRLPSFTSFAAASTSCPGRPLRRKLMLRFVVTARTTGPIADSSTTYIAKSANATSVSPDTVAPVRGALGGDGPRPEGLGEFLAEELLHFSHPHFSCRHTVPCPPRNWF